MDNDDIYLYDTERLHGIASDELVKQGLKYFNDQRVIGVAIENGLLLAQVEDVNEEQYWLELSTAADGTLQVACDCHAEQTVCIHAATVLKIKLNRIIWIPFVVLFRDGIEDSQQLPHASHQSNFFGFATRQQPVIKGLNRFIEADGAQGCHVQD